MQSSDRRLTEAVFATRRRLGRTTIVGISGIDCAGKSTLARRLAAGLRDAGEDVVVVEGDDFNRPRSERSRFPAEEPDYGFAYGQLIDELLVPIRAGGRVDARLRVKDWERDAWGEREFVVQPGAIVLVEGVFLFRPELLPLLDLTVWLEISFAEALARALVRDADAMGGAAAVRERYASRYFPGQRLHLERDRPDEAADLVLASGRSAAEAHPLVLVHGLSGSARWWRNVRAPLGERREVHVLDVPRIHPHDAPRWLVGWLDGAQIERVDLVGHSLGGLICARTAAAAPLRVRTLVLVAPAGVPTGRNVVAHAASLAATFAEAPAQAPRVGIDALRAGPGLLRSALYAATHDLRPELTRIVAPTLLVWGEQDRLVPIRLADEWRRALPAAQLVRVPGGHVPMWDAPDELTRAILDFVEEADDEVGDEARPRVMDRMRLAGDADEPAPR